MFQKAHAVTTTSKVCVSGTNLVVKRDWNKFEVFEWIQSLGVKGPGSEKLPDLFLKHCVDGDMLFKDIDAETLQELGIGYLQRKKILRELMQLVSAVEER